MNPSRVYICPPGLNTSYTSVPIPSLWDVPVHWLWVPYFMHWTWTGIDRCYCCSVTQSCLTLWDSHGLWQARLPYPSPSPGACSNSRLLSQWCHPTISSSVVPFSSHLQSFPASESFQMSQFFTSGGQSIGVSALAWILPMNIQDWFPLRLVWSPCSPRDSQESSPTSQFKSINFLVPSFLYSPVLIILFLFLWLILQHQKCRQGLSIVMKKLAPGIHSN